MFMFPAYASHPSIIYAHVCIQDVEWIESTAFELLLFQQFATYGSARIICRNVHKKHSEFVDQLGFRHYPDY